MAIVITKGSSKKEIQKKLSKISKSSKRELRKLCGSLKLEFDPLELQKKWRDEWE